MIKSFILSLVTFSVSVVIAGYVVFSEVDAESKSPISSASTVLFSINTTK